MTVSTIATEDNAAYFVNNANFNYVDLAVSEGLVHFIDSVLSPNASWCAPVNGTEEGTPAWPVSNSITAIGDGSGTASGAGAVASVTATGLAAAAFKIKHSPCHIVRPPGTDLGRLDHYDSQQPHPQRLFGALSRCRSCPSDAMIGQGCKAQ